MKFVEVDNDVFVNLDNVFNVSISPYSQNKYIWVFYSIDNSDDYSVYSRTFDSREEAREWLFNLY